MPSVPPCIESLETRQLYSADLSVSLIAVLQPSAIIGQKARSGAVVTARNIGTETFNGTASVELFLSQDHTFDGDDVPLSTTQAKLKLGAGKAKTLKIRIRSFPDAADGEYHLIARVNGTGVIPEASLDNNVAIDSEAHVQVANPRIDLSGAFSVIPTTARRGKSVTVRVSVGNIGNIIAAGRMTIALAASLDTTADPSGSPLATLSTKIKVKPDSVSTYKLKVRIPDDYPTGSFFLVGFVDDAAVFNETDEANNRFPAFSTIAIT